MTALKQLEFFERTMWEILQGDCLEVMRTFPDNHFSAIVTDPPYGLSFMNKGWDHAVPGREYWTEALRIAKPGSFLLAMGGTRTFHRLTVAIEDSGWEIRDTIAWIFGSGFPKSHNKFGLDGYGTALKPAHEPIIMAMKPLDGTFKQNAEKWGQAGINIDECRVESEESTLRPNGSIGGQYSGGFSGTGIGGSIKGRWPANVIFDEEASKLLDEQSGITQSKTNPRGGQGFHNCLGRENRVREDATKIAGHTDSGGASRFFYCAKASSRERNEGLEDMPEISKPLMGEFKNNPGRTVAKSSPIPRSNHHPTVKPLALMRYLITLVMPPQDGILLDPFAGSGSTILAAKRLGFDAIGIEKQKEYVDIANARLV